MTFPLYKMRNKLQFADKSKKLGANMNNQYGFGDEILKDVIVIDKLGGKNKSGFGVVYIVMDKNTGFILAMKTLQKEHISLPDFEKLKNEILPWMKVSDHPNIVTALTIELDENKRPHILMEPVLPDDYGRQTLNDFMQSNDNGEEAILKWCIQFCHAMEYVNQNGYIHGDIKPSNILISNGVIKITDFGLAKSTADKSEEHYGSPYYLAPESWDGIKNVSSEIYSFGMVMYQMCNGGVLPFDGIYDEEWKNFHKYGKVPKLNHDLFTYIKKCLEKDPKKRFASFSQLNEVLTNHLDEKFSQKIEKPELQDLGNAENISKGHLAAVLGDVENCKKYYDLAIENSDERIIRYNYALDLIDLNQYRDALDQLFNLADNPDVIPLERVYFNIGKYYHEGICIYKSIKYYKKAIEINKNDLKAHTNLANVYKTFGFYNDALIHYNYVLNRDDKFPQALINITDLYSKNGDKTNFEIFSSKIEAIQSNHFIDYYGSIILKDGNLLKYLTSMDNAGEDYRYQIPAAKQLFEFHLQNKNLPEANSKFNEIIELSNDIDLAIDLCFMYGDYGFNDEAIIKFDYIYDLFDEKRLILLRKSIFLEHENVQESIKICKNLLKENIDDDFKSDVYVNLGNFYSEINADESFICYLKAFKLNPKNMASLKNLAVHHAKNDEYFFAEDYVDKGLELKSDDYDFLFLKANLCRDQYKINDAIKYYRRCLKLGPSCEVYSYMGVCFGLLNKFEIALFYLELAGNINDGHFDMELFSLYPMVLGALGYIDMSDENM